MEVNRLSFIPKFLESQKGVREGDIVENFINFVEWVNEKQLRSKKLKEAVLEGKDVPLHEIVIESEKAKIALNLLIEIRNKLLEAYNELMKMQV